MTGVQTCALPISIQRPWCFFNLWSSCSSRPKQHRSCRMLLPPVAGCAVAEASPPPTILTTGQALRRRQPHTAAEPVNPRSPLRTTFHCRVVPFIGIAVVHHRGALRAAWSTWSRNDFHEKSTVRGEADSWVHGHSPFFCDLPSKSLCQACWAANLSRRGELSFG